MGEEIICTRCNTKVYTTPYSIICAKCEMKSNRKLEKMFELQIAFQERLGNSIPKYSLTIMSNENIELIKNQILAIVDESMEALREVPWKPWKVNLVIDLPSFRTELIDIFHFLINLFLYAGMNVEMVWKIFLEKNKINNQRQDNGY